MKRIIIFRYDREIEVCANHLELIKKLNPGVPIHAIFGGKETDFHASQKFLGDYFSTIYVVKNRASHFAWKNFDLVLRDWHKDQGYKVAYDMAYVIEWDLILLDSIEHLYGHIRAGEIGLTNLIELSRIESQWYWTSKEPFKSQWNELYKIVQEKYAYAQNPHASLGPGLCFPKVFLEKYSSIDIPELVHDEVRVPLFAQILGFALADTRFSKAWFDTKEYAFFNCLGKSEWYIGRETIEAEMEKPDGRRAFHPFREKLTI